MKSVLQNWVMELPLRHQGVLCAATRGCDITPKPGGIERQLSAYLRFTFMVPADERELNFPGAFMCRDAPNPEWKASELGHLPQHFYAHLMHAFQVVGGHHPDLWIRQEAAEIYFKMVRNLHLMPEPFDLMDDRLTEDRLQTGTVVS